MNHEELVNVATEAGSLLLRSGAEIYRVEESMLRIFEAYGVPDGDVFAIPSCIYVTLTTPQGAPVTRVKRILNRSVNLDLVDRTNDVCRRICREKPPLAEAKRLLDGAAGRPVFGLRAQLLGSPLVGFFFCLFFGGSLLDACVAAVCSAAMRLLIAGLERYRVNAFFCNLCGGAVSGFLTLATVLLGLSVNTDTIIIGALMNLVPGIVITTFMRDMMAGDVVAGLIRFSESLLVATAIALGVGVSLVLPRLIFGV